MSKYISGKIIGGNKLGTKLGFPTLNMAYDGGMRGVFVGRVLLNSREFMAAVHIGERSIVDDDAVTCEAYILDWDDNIGKINDMELEILSRVRDSKKFSDPELLKKQISEDVEFVKNWYTKNKS